MFFNFWFNFWNINFVRLRLIIYEVDCKSIYMKFFNYLLFVFEIFE